MCLNAAIAELYRTVHYRLWVYQHLNLVSLNAEEGEQYGVGVSKDNPALLEALDAALVEMDEDGSMAELQTKWFGQEL